MNDYPDSPDAIVASCEKACRFLKQGDLRDQERFPAAEDHMSECHRCQKFQLAFSDDHWFDFYQLAVLLARQEIEAHHTGPATKLLAAYGEWMNAHAKEGVQTNPGA